MSRRSWLAIALLMATVAVALPASAVTDPCVDPATGAPTFASQQTYIHQGQTKAGNLGATGQTGFPSWNTTAPSQSVQQGAGGGYLGFFALAYAGRDDTPMAMTATGTFSGCLDTVLITLYAILPTNKTGSSGDLSEAPLDVYANLTVDGTKLITSTPVETKTIANTGGQATYRVRYAFTNLNQALLNNNKDPLANHSITISASPQYVNTSNALFVYDTTEVPAGILFNGAVDDTYSVIETG
jgi:hypothetical protein